VIATLRDVVVPGHTLLPADATTGRLLSAYGSGHMNWGHAYPSPILRRVDLPGLAFAVAPVRNYFHLLVEHVLPALDALLRHPELRREPMSVIVSDRLPTVRYFVELMAALGVAIRVVEANRFTAYRPEAYLFAKPVSATVEHFYAYAEAVALLKDAVRRRGDPPPVSERVYIPRTGTRIRQLGTEAALVARLAERGFAPFTATWSNIDRQVATFLAAREIVSVHGAALTNLVWAPADAHVVELFPVNARKTTYLHMASLHGQAYSPVIGGPEDERQSFAAPVEAVLEALR
jgi:capsular polysaccharide biosynthesis protein